MTSASTLAKILASPDATSHDGASELELDAVRSALGELPAVHVELLRNYNGVLAYGGYFRLFPASWMIWWNDIDTWKFAWPARVRDFVCIGETAWGDQYAYLRKDLGKMSVPVYFMDAVMMRAELIADSVATFLDSEFLRSSLQPYDELLVAARRRLGRLRLDEHVVNVPSILIKGDEAVGEIEKMPAVAAMVVNGDLATQLGEVETSAQVSHVEPYVDDRGRARLRVHWSPR